MTLPTFNTKSPTIKRILKEASELSSNPDPTLHAAPLDSNLFEWHFTLRGPPSTPYSHGAYHGRIILPPAYPHRPPSFRFLTPSGRFEVNREICLSISDHHEETWQPAWGIRTALWALRAFMEGDARGQVGGMEMGRGERERLAGESRGWRCGGCGGRRNEDILREEGGGGEEGQRGVVNVPEELKFGFRDEMGGGKGEGGEPGVAKASAEASSAKENPTAPTITQALPTSSSSTTTSPPPQPTRTIPLPSTANIPPSQTQTLPPPARQVQSDGVPAWVDKAIAALVAALAFMVMRKLLL
ncbi:hypothetical protein JMJ35_009847 [Cladonia borealis]|uniref:UBC core domain-containing protein n=1 Tax=Cladonia borealis TaxID=184061 RepID=A0AA39UXS6_9LECA|nr:hypothetical protein JMJ35_009847 [Cladonia borealis]